METKKKKKRWQPHLVVSTCLLLAGGCSETPARPTQPGDKGPVIVDGTGPVCGNSVREGAELCDGADLGGRICTTEGFGGGTLACKTDCTLDPSGCFRCGDGKLGGSEACDGTELGGKTCKTQGFDSGALACTASCQIDLSKCTIASCGNGKKDPAEPCEGKDLGAKTCKSEGFEGGALSCNANCSLNLSACFKCGDGIINGSESCDGAQLGGKTCKSLGFTGGTLGCKADCTFSTSACQSSPAPDAKPASDKTIKGDLSVGTLDGINWGTGPLPEGNSGIAAKYKGDVGITSDPAVVFADDFESYASAANLTSKWDEAYQSGHVVITTAAADVYRGNKALQFDVPKLSGEMSNTAAKHLGKELDVLFLRYYSKYDAAFDVLGSSHNGAMISAHYYVNGQASPGVPANGTNKFLASFEAGREDASTPNPGDLNIYIYHPEQRSQWGDHFFPTGLIKPFTSQPHNFGSTFVPRPDVVPKLGQWYSYEFMVKANTPGKRDGRIACWLDGKLIADFPNLRLRDVSTLKIDRFNIDLHINGTTNGVNKKWYDNVVAATSYIGPLVDP